MLWFYSLIFDYVQFSHRFAIFFQYMEIAKDRFTTSETVSVNPLTLCLKFILARGGNHSCVFCVQHVCILCVFFVNSMNSLCIQCILWEFIMYSLWILDVFFVFIMNSHCIHNELLLYSSWTLCVFFGVFPPPLS